MGTNYYHRDAQGAENGRHIGKRSGGWSFALHVYPAEGINTLADWEKLWSAGVIENECGDLIGPQEMRRIVMEGAGPRRREVDSVYVVANDPAGFDCMVGEFS